MATGYEDIDKLTEQQGTMLDESLKQQQDIVNKQTQMNIDALEKNKTEIDQQADKVNQGLYTEYKKASNPYGVNAEATYARGLGNSGYAETTQTNLYNTYQKNVTDTVNNAQKLKADFDFQISQARQNGDITLAQNALQIYMQKMQLLTQEYELRNNREQYLYQKEQDALQQSNWEKEYAYQQERDAVSDNQWQQSFDYNKSRDEVSDRQYAEQMAYQRERDAVSDSQWAKEYALSRSKASSGNNNQINIKDDDSGNNNETVPMSENVQRLLNGLTSYNVAETTDEKLKEDARKLIYEDKRWGRITESEADYLFKQLNL